MDFTAALTLIVLLAASLVQSTALYVLAALSKPGSATYKIDSHEKQCFFAGVTQAGAKIAFYFAVQSGASFDIDFEIVGPGDRVVMQEEKERQGDFVFTAQEIGEYRFCFDNEMSSVSDKTIDFEITVENESKASIPFKQGVSTEQTSVVSESIYKLSSQLSTIQRMQKYFRTRENRNFSTVRSTEKRIFRFSIMENLIMVVMAGLQVFVVRFFFTGARKGHV